MESEQALIFPSRAAWREWLERNHAKEKGAWLLHYKKASGKHSLNYRDAVEEALCFGWIDGKMKSLDEEKFILKYSPRRAKSLWSKINKEKAEQLIAQGRMTPAGFEKIEEARRNGLWDSAYTSQVKEAVPPDLKEALSRDRAARDNFQHLANSYRNMYIIWVNQAKTAATRQKRIAAVVKRSALNRKPGTA
jgi:uncharacterized protein YdeI (YjbR/CyaY-like superfamily)